MRNNKKNPLLMEEQLECMRVKHIVTNVNGKYKNGAPVKFTNKKYKNIIIIK